MPRACDGVQQRLQLGIYPKQGVAGCQRSFNWQSTAFVMRGLRVRLPPLALWTSTHGSERAARPALFALLPTQLLFFVSHEV
jgi:hypothetical protein